VIVDVKMGVVTRDVRAMFCHVSWFYWGPSGTCVFVYCGVRSVRAFGGRLEWHVVGEFEW
jgi:hypothetical protein